MSLEMGYGQYMQMRPSPSLIQFTEILALSSLDLEALIEEAVDQNPALELHEVSVCPACGDPLLADGSCYRCQRGLDLAHQAAGELAEPEEETQDPWLRVADQRSLAEHLIVELATVLDESDLPIAEHLIGELNDRGFLETPLSALAEALSVPRERVARVLTALQTVGPAGIGARSVSECLLLQLERWSESGVDHPLARAIVSDHLPALAQGKYSQLAEALGVSYEEVLAARDFIRSHLRPYPIAERIDLEPWQGDRGTGFVAPDIIVRLKEDDSVDVEVVESRRYALSISPLYRNLASRLAAGSEPSELGLGRADERHVRQQVSRAETFLAHIRERRETIRRVAVYVMERQKEYLRKGPRYLKPLTRAEVAEALALHESTVSRATAGKYVLLPSRHVVLFAEFFRAALPVHDVLKELVANESRPLSDAELATELRSRGYRVARRTVAKYRAQLGILPSSLR